jgi:hyaluronoglucosaminidase
MRWLAAGSVGLLIVTAIVLVVVVVDKAGEDDGGTRVPPLVGVVEGAYGRSWTSAERMEVLRLAARQGLNAYVHAPKTDVYSHDSWRTPEPASTWREYEREIAFARENGIQWIPNISPGTPRFPPEPKAGDPPPSRPLCLTCPADAELLIARFRRFVRAGTATVMLSFDDVRRGFDPRRDPAAGRREGQRTGRLVTRVQDALRADNPDARVLLVPTEYAGTEDTPYLTGLRETLPPDAGVIWTGPTRPPLCCGSVPFAAAEARTFGRHIGRRPILWDNFFNNDREANRRIFLGPYRREAAVAAELDGVLVNVSVYAELNLIGLATAGDWAKDPAGYDARTAFRRAVRTVGGGEAEALRAFAEVNHSTKVAQDDDAPTFAELSGRLLDAEDPAAREEAAGALRAELELVRDAEPALRSDPATRPLARRTVYFLRAARASAEAALAATDLLVAPAARRSELRRRLATLYDEARADGHTTFGNRQPLIGMPPPSPRPTNRLDRFVRRVLDATS